MYLRHLLFAILLLTGCLAGRAQSFSSGNGGGIPNDSSWYFFDIPVTGLTQTTTSSAFGVSRSCINISCPDAAVLNVRLLTPDSSGITLASLPGNRIGGFTNTCFAMNVPMSILNAAAPFTGTFVSQQFFSPLNQGHPTNGTWRLAIKNESAIDVAIFNSATVSFQANPPADPTTLRLCTEQNPAGCQCPDGSDTCDLLPDMIASAKVIATDNRIVGDSLRLGNGTPNVGWGPLEIHGTAQCFCDTARVPCSTPLCPDGNLVQERVIQRIYRREGDNMVTRDKEAGFMRYHPGHGHVHIDGWATYSLRVRNASSNPKAWPVIATGGKTSFCLVNTGACTEANGNCKDLDGRVRGPSNIANYGFGTVTGCGRDQGIFTGSLDVYSSGLSGQTIPLAGVCSGDYYIVSETDPNNFFEETDDSNNTVVVPISLTRPNSGVMPVFNTTPVGQLYAFAATNLPGNTDFVWDFGDGTRDSVNNPVIHMFARTGGFTVTLTYKGQTCGNTMSSRFIGITSVSTKLSAASFALQVQPNPATDLSVISFNLPSEKHAALYVTNTLGAKVKVFAASNLKAGINTLKLGTRLAPGLYTAILDTERGRAATKFIVH